MSAIDGFSKLSKLDKITWLADNFATDKENFISEFKNYWHQSPEVQKRFDEFTENTITNFYIPFSIAPNFLINGQMYAIPMVIEESSVVAAAAKSAKFWLSRGGFHSKIVSTTKIGQVHFLWNGDFNKMYCIFDEIKEKMLAETASITKNMKQRGGGILDIELRDMRMLEENYYQIWATFETCDSMGANFINSCLEAFARVLREFVLMNDIFTDQEKDVNVIMSILSNYTPECRVQTWVECPIQELGQIEEFSAEQFAFKFKTAVNIAKNDPYRATTHNKGIFNGIDAVILATGNDFRAVEACGHTYAARSGQYRSLTDCSIENGIFKFWIDIPMALGTVGGLTTLHPIVKRSFEILGYPNAEQLMMIASATGLAQNFGAVKSLVTTGIQKGHMKMHLLNILHHFEASEDEKVHAIEYFKTNVVSFNAVRELLEKIRDAKYEMNKKKSE